MRSWTLLVLLCLSACAKPTLYESWGQHLGKLPEVSGRLEDVSFLLGTPPSRCEPVADASPIIGVNLDLKRPVVQSVSSGGPADQAGIERGDTIESIADIVTPTTSAVVSQIKEDARDNAPLRVATNRGIYQVFPRIPHVEQCYWEVHAGEIGRAGGTASVSQYGGAARATSSVYQRFFRTSCRIHDGYVASCRSNWQQ